MAIKPINHFSLTNNATVYDEESMTALELATRTAGKMNETVNAFNELEVNTGKRIATQDKVINDAVNKLPEDVEKSVDDHLENGEFDSQIGKYLGDVTTRLDNLSKTITPGSTSGDAELIDLRTDAEGDTYSNAGGSVRGQFKKVKGTIMDFAELDTEHVNLWNPDTVIKEKYLGLNGTEYEGGANYYNAEYIPVHPGCKIVTSFYNSTTTDRSVCSMRFVVAYSENKTVLPGSGAENTKLYTVPDGVYFIRISLQNYYYNKDLQVDCSPNGTPTPYKPYSKARYVVKGLDEINARTYFTHHGKNLLNPSTVTYGHYLYIDGSTHENEDYIYTDFISVTPGDIIVMSYENTYGARTINEMRFIVAYDENKGLFRDKSSELNEKLFTVPDGIYYLRISYLTKFDVNAMIEISPNGVPSAYVKYIEPVTLPIKHVIENLTEYAGAGEKAISSSVIKPIETQTITNNPADELWLSSVDLSENHIIKNKIISFEVKQDTNVNALITVGHGYGYGSMYMRISGTTCEIYSFTDIERLVHTETFTDEIINPSGYISVDHTGKAKIFIHGDNGAKSEFTFENWTGRNGQPFIKCDGALKMSLSFYSGDYNANVWAFGDSYFHPSSADRWTSYLIKDGYTNLMLDGFPGRNSTQALSSLKNALTHGTPTHVVWCLGMNDGNEINGIAPGWRNTLAEVQELCNSKNIELILATIPNATTVNNSFKNEYIRESGYRFIDFEKAVEGIEWASSDGIHPNETGAKALYNRVFIDFPEIITTRR